LMQKITGRISKKLWNLRRMWAAQALEISKRSRLLLRQPERETQHTSSARVSRRA
jgi:hypothetical protein